VVGTVEPLRRSIIGAEIAGLVREMPVRQGQFVQAGQALCQLKDELRRHQYAQEVAKLGSLKARLTELEAGTRQEELDRWKATLEEAAALKQKWEFEKRRLETLMEGRSASTKEYHDTITEFEAAIKRLAQADAAYRLALAGPRQEVIAQARHEVAAQEAAVARTAEELSKTRIAAPFDGFVVTRYAEVGQWLPVGGKVVELADLSAVLVRVDLPERVIGFNRLGDRVRVKIDALERWFEGRIEHLIPQAAVSARTFPVEIRVDNADFSLKSGLFARAIVAAGATAPGICVPRDAVVRRGGAEFVAVLVPGPAGAQMAIPTPVQTGAESDGWVAVTSGNMVAGTPVVVRGNEKILFPTPVQPEDMEVFQPALVTTTAPAAAAGSGGK